MSNQSPFGGRTAQAFPTLPRGDVLGTYDSYPEAQRVVAKLAESDFPVAKIAIVGNDLKTVERVTGKMTYGRAAIAGALSGLWLGIFFGIVLTLFSPTAGGLIIAAAIIGAAFGMLYGIVSFAITKRQRDFTSVHQVLATNYQIVVDPQLTGQAQKILGQFGATQSTHWDSPSSSSSQGAPVNRQEPWRPEPRQQQEPWRPDPRQQQAPYGGHATPHQQPGGTQQSGTSAPGAQTGAPRYGTNDGPRYGEVPSGAPVGPAAGQPGASSSAPAGPPRYGTNDGPRYQPPAAGADRPAEAARPDEQPQFGERVTPTSAPSSAPEQGRGDGERRPGDEESPRS
ncbi:general stress protein [Curtobacterium sp. 458]|uniref:general stress protein n=1 Tax=Curtobacterium sp. 458 TaxID=3050069 RepID=UPI0025B4A24C|nr:general stress protein [Curtobacterium sp. 458]WJY00164.1 ECF transporter S component [Curtobacterium sp. 458]